ncbi:MAG: UDP-N-acetylmuramate--L-alanine ligase [Chitinophagaceae bacterium]|nr:UDP-N-acetylmuramate--L-alanine ligase [Chitinophagaceae bacterium]
MIKLNDISRIYFIGIGGIGMSALARYFNYRKVVVSGYDRTETPLTKALEAEGIKIHYTDDIDLADKEAQLIVYTPAIPSSHTELTWFRDNGFSVVKRSDVLGIITEGSFNICIAGTHGKTSISTMVAHLLRHTQYGCNAFLGGISANYGTNFWASEKNICVIEADEYDRSFLKLNPDISVITSMDPDHLDIYQTAEAMEEAFVAFAAKTKSTGCLIRKHGLNRLNESMVRKQLTYQLSDMNTGKDSSADSPDVFVINLENSGYGYRFDVSVAGDLIQGFEMNVGGLHNVENMTVAITIARMLNIDKQAILKAVNAYKGVKRRFEIILSDPAKTIFIDDYAHHPGEIEALLKSVRGLFPGKRITVLFQPHLFTRTRDFADGFAESLSIADDVLLLPVYPARELPIEGVSNELIGKKMQRVTLLEKQDVVNWIGTHDTDVFVTAGAGDIDAMVLTIKNALESKK